jgi:hypothetical protein
VERVSQLFGFCQKWMIDIEFERYIVSAHDGARNFGSVCGECVGSRSGRYRHITLGFEKEFLSGM